MSSPTASKETATHGADSAPSTVSGRKRSPAVGSGPDAAVGRQDMTQDRLTAAESGPQQDDAWLAPLLAPIADLPGVGPAQAKLLTRAVGGSRVVDLLFHMPESVVDRRYRPALSEAQPGRVATLEATVRQVTAPAHGRQPWKVQLEDGAGRLEVAFFSRWQAGRMTSGARVLVSGLIDTFNGRLAMTNPDYVLSAGDAVPTLDPVWPLTAGLFTGQVRSAMRKAFARLPELPEWEEPSVIARRRWPDFRTALLWTHFPSDDPAISGPEAPTDAWIDARRRARERLACDELLADQAATLLAREANRSRPGRSLIGSGALRREALTRFGHSPTAAQTRALREIGADLEAPRRMVRLLQGDVGAGKTLVALLTMLQAVEAGAQAAIMAPTEILARQHLTTFERLSPVPVAFLSGSVRGKARKATLEAIADGSASLIVGTHALVQEGVRYHDLALAVVDEQHRFGVEQRLTLGGKGAAVDMLVMTATPIPRTLLLTQWGDMQVSRLDGKPAGRKPIKTSVHGPDAFDGVLSGLERALASGARVFWVCPLVSESETLDIAAAEARHASLVRRFEDRYGVGLAHGQQDIAVREAALAAFANGHTAILVATTVIEVGVDVPSASVMVIEHAERFGLAQLHQLRGRVGRGSAESFCLLLHGGEIGVTAKRRLSLLKDTEDGFLIADEDFRLRGGGEVAGSRQSGLPGFRIATMEANLDETRNLVVLARQSAERGLQGRHPDAAFRCLLKLFGKAKFDKIMQAG